jgi:hypothetical protein
MQAVHGTAVGPTHPLVHNHPDEIDVKPCRDAMKPYAESQTRPMDTTTPSPSKQAQRSAHRHALVTPRLFTTHNPHSTL